MKEKINEKSIIKYVGLLIVIVIVFVGGFVLGRLNPKAIVSNNQDFTLFWEVWNTLTSEYVDKTKINEEEMYYGSIKGMVDSFGDPATIYLDPSETKEFNNSIEGKTFTGIGAELNYDNNQIVVVSPIDGSPAQKAGIKTGDIILQIDGVDIKSTDSIYDVVAKIRGESGTKVTLTVLHNGASEVSKIEIIRGEIDVPSIEVKSTKVNSNIKVLKVSRFTDESVSVWNKNWDDAVSEIVKANPKALILDLRGNPGGYFDSAVYAANEFLPKGAIVSKQEDKNGDQTAFRVNRVGKLLNIPLVVLVNEGSASASEILAGALQQNDRGTLVGLTTYGKGTAQSIVTFNDGSSLHITILKWLLPDGSWIKKDASITPDVVCEYPKEDFEKGIDTQLNKAVEILEK